MARATTDSDQPFNTDPHDVQPCGCPYQYHTQDCPDELCPSTVDMYGDLGESDYTSVDMGEESIFPRAA